MNILTKDKNVSSDISFSDGQRIKAFLRKDKLPDGVFLVFREYPYTIEVGDNTVMSIDSIEILDTKSRWVEKDGWVEEVSPVDIRKRIEVKSSEILRKHSKLLELFSEYFGFIWGE